MEDNGQMTVYQSLAKWLNGLFADPENGFPPNLEVITDLELVPSLGNENSPGSEVQNSGLFSNPNDRHVQRLAGDWRHVEFKTWYLVRRFASMGERVSAEDFLGKIRRAIQRASRLGIMPRDGRQWRGIEVSGGIFPSRKSDDNKSAVYRIPLKIEYVE